ncbi:MAG: hypothetical protein ABJO27_22420 [Pseudoruegeria sp.]
MSVTGVSQAGPNEIDHSESMGSGSDQMMFADMLNNEKGDKGEHHRQAGGQGQPPHQGRAGMESGQGEYADTFFEGASGDFEGQMGGAPARQHAADLRTEADDLRSQADSIDGAEGATQEDADIAQTLRSRADALDQRADAVEERAEIAENRQLIAERGDMLNGGEFDPEMGNEIGDGPVPRPVDAEPVQGWSSEADVERFEAALSAISEFSDIDVVATREATDAEVDLFLEQALASGATTDSLDVDMNNSIELVEGYAQAFPIQFVFVDGLESDYGMEVATGGELAVENTTTILLDSKFATDDFTFEDGITSDAGLEAVEFAFDSILEIFEFSEVDTSETTADDSVSTEDQNSVEGDDVDSEDAVGSTTDLENEE